MSIERIVAVVVDTQRITLYREDTSSFHIDQGHPLVKRIVSEVIPIVDAGGIAEFDMTIPNVYKDFEEKSGGLVRFFRVAKKAITNLFGEESPTIETGAHGQLPETNVAQAVSEIISRAEPANTREFREAATTEEHTMIAVTKDSEGNDKIVPGVEQVREQIKYSSKIGSTKGMENFLRRVGAVIDQRPHSVQDLLRFLERGDLPIADDGSIIAYKKLYSRPDGRYVDPHTRKVSQTIGSYVCVDEKLVDLNRRNECSNGLHIGRRGYMGSFSGDTLMICKIDPEDVMVVPHNDPNKVRVKGYHILAKLDDRAFKEICEDRPATSGKRASDLLSNVIAGKHVARLEKVCVHGQSGTNVEITPLVPVENSKLVPVETQKHYALDDKKIAEPSQTPSKPVDPKKIAANQTKGAPAVGSRRSKAMTLCQMALDPNRSLSDRQKSANELMAFKKQSKAGWEPLGVGPDQVTKLQSVIAESEPVKEVPADPIGALTPSSTEGLNKSAGSVRANAIKAMLDRMNNTRAAPAERAIAAEELLEFRKKAKISWTRLGHEELTDDALRAIIGRMMEAKTPISKEKPETKAEEARRYFKEKHWAALGNLKKTSKKSWSALGFSDAEIDRIQKNVRP